jgi:4-hydroxy-tetrahydrodipicolinate synthase
MYNIPGRTGCNMSAETCLELAHDCENIAGIKEASGDLSQMMKIIKGKPENFGLISGDDMLTIPVIAAGGIGVISVLGNAFPGQVAELVSLALRNNFKSAREIHFRHLEMIDLLFVEGNPAGIKAMLSTMNICHNNLRLPLVSVSRTTMTRIQKAVEEIATS